MLNITYARYNIIKLLLGNNLKHTRTHELLKRLLITIAILALYLIGRNILIYKIDVSAYHLDEIDQQNLLYSYLTGDRYKYTIFSLGIMPYITSSLIISTFFIPYNGFSSFL